MAFIAMMISAHRVISFKKEQFICIEGIAMPKNKLTKLLGKASMDIYDELGGLNFDEKDFQIALGYELDSNGIEYLKEKLILSFFTRPSP